MPNGFIVDWVTPGSLTVKKTEVSKSWGDIMDFVIKSEYYKCPICSFFLTCYTARGPISPMNLFVDYTIKVVRKVSNIDKTT